MNKIPQIRLLFFGLLFLGTVCCFYVCISSGVVKPIYEKYFTGEWIPHKASLMEYSSRIDKTRDKRGATTRTLSIKARYVYKFIGKEYTGNKVFSSGSSSASNTFAVGKILERHYQNGTFIDIWIRKDKPSQAVVFRGFSWGFVVQMSIFSSIFAGLSLLFFRVMRNILKAV